MRKLRSLVLVTAIGVLIFSSLGLAQPQEQSFLVFVDDLHLDFRSTPRLRELMRRMLTTLAREGDRIALVSTGPSSVAVAPTSDLQRLTSGVSLITGNGFRPDQIVDPRHFAERVNRATVAITTARDAIQAVASRTSQPLVVIYISGGYGEPSLVTELAELALVAFRANATIYAFEARGLVSGPYPPRPAGNQSAWEAYYRDARDSLRTLAESSGGWMISTGTEFVDAMARIARPENR
jgi:hypothetical protein